MMVLKDSSRVLLLIGVYRDDWEDERFRSQMIPVVAGCVDETVWSHEEDEDTQRRWAKCKEAYDPHGTDYEWREVWVRLDGAGLRAPFEIPDVKAEVEQA